MIYYRHNPNRSIYFSSFVMMILQLNDIKCKEGDLIDSPKILGYGVVEKMGYYKDLNGDYYYLEDSGRKIYDDKFLEKEVTEMNDLSTVGGSAATFTSIDVKTLLDDVL